MRGKIEKRFIKRAGIVFCGKMKVKTNERRIEQFGGIGSGGAGGDHYGIVVGLGDDGECGEYSAGFGRAI